MMNCRRLSRILILCLIVISFILYYKTINKTEEQYIEDYTIDTDVARSLSQLNNKGIRELKLIAENTPQYHYFVRKSWHLGKLCQIYDIDGADIQEYPTPVLYIEILENKEKEKRINRMLIERYVMLLPNDTVEEWWKKQEIRITYRSDRYLCFQYFSNAALPKGYSDKNLYFTLDLENESIMEYPNVEGQEGKFAPDTPGNLYKELEEYQEKTVKEQSTI